MFNMEKLLKKIADMQGLAPKDELAKVIEPYLTDENEEIEEEDLDMVFAARKDYYEEFAKQHSKDR